MDYTSAILKRKCKLKTLLTFMFMVTLYADPGFWLLNHSSEAKFPNKILINLLIYLYIV